MKPEITESVRREIEGLHEFFVRWFSGADAADEQVFARDFSARFDDGFVLIPPAGVTLGLDDLSGSVSAGHGGNPDFRIAIRNVVVRRTWPGHVLATYEEWQRHALASTPPDNGRVATVLFRIDGETLRWLHVHETWLPEDVMRAGPYDF